MVSNFNALFNASLENEFGVKFVCLMSADCIFLFWFLCCFEGIEEWLNNMVSIHVHHKLLSLILNACNKLNQYLVGLIVWLRIFESFYLIKVILRVLRSLNNTGLWAYIFVYEFWEFFNEQLNDSGSMKIQRYSYNCWANLVDNHLNVLIVWFFNNFLAKVVSE